MNTPSIDPQQSKQKLIDFAINELGFDDCRVSTPWLNPADQQRYEDWLNAGYYGQMDYLKRHWPLKKDPEQLLKGVKTAIVLSKNYKNTEEKSLKQEHKIARYAVGQDYHLVIASKLKHLERFLCAWGSDVRCYSAVDSRPIAERSLALNAGNGFLGKNTMVIKPGLGSYFFLAVVLCNLALPVDQPINVDCGECRLCLDACPTGALLEDYQMDSRLCISYQSIEQKEPMSVQQKQQSQGWRFGCDICQEVCPYNHGKAELTDWPEFMPQSGVGFDVFAKPEEISTKISKKTPLYRSRKQLKQNCQYD